MHCRIQVSLRPYHFSDEYDTMTLNLILAYSIIPKLLEWFVGDFCNQPGQRAKLESRPRPRLMISLILDEADYILRFPCCALYICFCVVHFI